MNYYRRWVGNYLKKTARLSILEHGAYNLMLDYYYAEEQPLPTNHMEVYRLVRALTPDEQRAVDRILDKFFVLAPDGYHNARADEELGIAMATIEAQRESGTKTANKRWGGGNGGGGSSTDKPERSSTDRSTDTASGIGQPNSSTNAGDRSVDRSTNEKVDRSPIQPPTSNHHPPAFSLQPPTTNHQKTKARPKSSGAYADAVLPDWIPGPPWRNYVEMRKAKHKPMTVKACELIHKKLGVMRLDGQDIGAVLLQSVENGWTSVFPVKPASSGSRVVDQNRAAGEAWLRNGRQPS